MASATVVLKKGILAFAGIAALVALAGCSTLPHPASFDSSLLVLESAGESSTGVHAVSDRVILSGPVPIRLDLTGKRDRVSFFRVKPGRYVLVSRTVRLSDGRRVSLEHPEGVTIDVPPATILLPAWKFSAPAVLAGNHGRVVVPTTPADRRLAARTLADYVRVARWAGRRVTGFAPYSPFTDYVSKKFTVHIESTPAGSQAIIDGQNWGTTPLPVSLTPGRHLVLLEHAGYLKHSAFIDVENNGTESFVLDPVPSGGAGGAAGKSAVLVEPFEELGTRADTALGTLLTKSLRAALARDGVVVLEQAAATSSSPAARPDFSAAERAGATVLVAGDYTTNARTVLLHAALYDARSRLVKASVVEAGDTGLSLFESIDRMSSALAAAVEKELPEVGHRVVQERVMTPQTVNFDARVNEQDVIRKRNAKKYTFSIGPALAGVLDNVSDPNSPSSSTGRINGPGLGIYGSAGFPISGPLTLNLATLPFFYMDANKSPKVEIPLYAGARWNFYGYMSDIYLGLQGAAHFAPATAVSFSSGSPTPAPPVTVGPFWLFGLNFEAGVRIYTYQRVSSLPTYLGFGLTLGLFGYRFNINFTNPTAYPMEIALRLYWGTRL